MRVTLPSEKLGKLEDLAASSVEPGVGERCVGDALPIGGTRLYSPASRLLNVVDFLACFQGMVVRSTPPL